MNTFRFTLKILNGTVTGLIDDPKRRSAPNFHGNFSIANNYQVINSLATRLYSSETELSSNEIKNMGTLLFRALFNGSVLDTFLECYSRISKNNTDWMRLELNIIDETARGLPWEFLYVPQEYQIRDLEPFLAASDKVTLVRSAEVTLRDMQYSIDLDRGLLIGLGISAPKVWDLHKFPQQYGEIDSNTLANKLETLRQDQSLPIKTVLKVSNPATTVTLKNLIDLKPHILHFIGHGDVLDNDNNQKEACLILVDDAGVEIQELWAPQVIHVSKLVRLFESYKPAIVILQACNTGKHETEQKDTSTKMGTANLSLAENLIKIGIPVVIAMQYEIQNNKANDFSIELYKKLLAGYSLETSVNAARRLLFEQSLQDPPFQEVNRNFGTPLIYINFKDSHLFPHPFEVGSFGALGRSFLSITGLDAINTELAYRTYETCLDSTTGLRPLPPYNTTLASMIGHLAQAITIQDNHPHPLAYFSATIAEHLQTANPPLAQKINIWLQDNSTYLSANPDLLSDLVCVDKAELDPPSLLISMRPELDHMNLDEKNKKYKVRVYFVRDTATVPLLSENGIYEDKMPTIVDNAVNMVFDAYLKPGEHEHIDDLLWIEIFRNTQKLSSKVEEWAIDDEQMIGKRFKVVVRSLYRWDKRMKLRLSWPRRWELFKRQLAIHSTDIEKVILNPDLQENFSQVTTEITDQTSVLGFVLDPINNSEPGMLTSLLDSGIPVLLWVRKGVSRNVAENWMKKMIGTSSDLRRLPDLIRKERLEESDLGKHLVLLWDNFDHRLGLDENKALNAPDLIDENAIK